MLLWASGRPGACEVAYEGGEVLLCSGGRIVARLGPGAVPAAPDPVERPHWEVFFTVRLLIGHFSARYKTLNELLDEAQTVFPETELALEGKTFVIGEE